MLTTILAVAAGAAAGLAGGLWVALQNERETNTHLRGQLASYMNGVAQPPPQSRALATVPGSRP